MNTFTRRQIAMGAAALAGSLVLPARAAGYPERDILFVNPWSAAGATDAMIRQYTKQMEQVLPGANFTIQSMTGGSGTIGVGTVLRSKPDGYTIGFAGNSTLVYQPMVMKGLAWSKPTDVQPLVKLSSMPTVLVVRADSPLKTFDDFFKEALAKPLRVGIAGLRTSSDLELQQMNLVANTKIRTIPFTGGTGESILALLGGRTEALTSYAAGVSGHVKANAMRVLAVFQDERYEPFPDATPVGAIKSLSEITILPSTSYVIAPVGLPKDVLDTLVTSSRKVVTSDEFKAFAKRSGLVLDPAGPDQIRAELTRAAGTYEKLIKHLDSVKS